MVRARRFTLLLMLALLPLFVGCESEEDRIYKQAYDANYAANYPIGFKTGAERGSKQGAEEGAAAAREAATTGQAWQLYWVLALGSLVSGLVLGLSIQYGILLICRFSGRLPQFSTVAFVPAMKSTVVYAIFERRRDVMIEIDEQLREMAARKNLQVAKIRELKEAVALKIKALSSIEELSQSRLLELAAEELERIVADSARKAEATLGDQGSDRATTRITHTCPYCKRLVRFNLRSANEIITCPNQECGQSIRLPAVFSDVDGAPLILDVND